MEKRTKFDTMKTFGNLRGIWGRDDERNIERSKCYGETYTHERGIPFKFFTTHTKEVFVNRIEGRIEKLNIPKKYKNATFDKLEDALKYEKGGFLLVGQNATGKTYTAYAILKFRILMRLCRSIKYDLSKKDDMYFVDCQELFDTLRDSFNDSTISRPDIIKKYSECDVLVLDDIGSEKVTEFTSGTLRRIINYREAHDKDTIMTTNYVIAELDELLGTSITSRIKRMCKVVTLNDKV